MNDPCTARGDRPGAARRRLRSPEVREHLDRLPLQTDPTDFAELLAAAAGKVVAAERAECRLGDSGDGPDAATGGDPDRELAVLVTDPGGDVLGVLAVARDPGAEPFGPGDAAALEALARHGGALLTILPPPAAGGPSRTSPRRPARRPAPETPGAPTGPAVPGCPSRPALSGDLDRHKRGPADVFRRQALESRREADEHGKPLELGSGWLRWAFRILVAGFAAGLVLLATAETADRVAGAAEVRIAGDGAPWAAVLLPAPAGARVRPGMEGRLRLDAVPGAEVPIVVRAVSSAPDAGGGEWVLAEAGLPGSRAFRDGMRGRAEIVVGRRPLLHGLMPGLRTTGGGEGGDG